MNKKVEGYLKEMSGTARTLLKDKKFYEKQIAKEKKAYMDEKNSMLRGVASGVEIGLKIAAMNNKKILELMLFEDYLQGRREKWISKNY